jgi:hypothetical protein
MMKRALVLLAALVTQPVLAQAPPVHNCVTQTCTIISDPFPPPPSVQPVSCELSDGATVLETAAVAGPAGAVYCRFVRNFTVGAHSITAKAIAEDGFKSAASNTYPFVSSAGAPPVPTNIRAQ